MRDALRILIDLAFLAALLGFCCHWASLGLRAGDSRPPVLALFDDAPAAPDAAPPAPRPAAGVPGRDFVLLAGLDG